MMTRCPGIFLFLFMPFLALAQGGDQSLRLRADAIFKEDRFSDAMPLYAQLVSLHPTDRDLSYRFGTCIVHSAGDKERAIGFLKYATEDPSITPKAWYYLGRAYHLNYRFNHALAAYQRYKGTADKRLLVEMPVDAMEDQCRNGLKLLGNIKEVSVRRKVEVKESEFFRYYDLSDIGGRIVVTPPELLSPLDKRSKRRFIIYLPDHGGPIYFSSYGKDGKTGLDIYRTQLLPDGKFATPEKLPGHINTDRDEDFAFMHRDGRTFYFSSQGHTSMGGYDVFKSVYDQGLDTYGRPENLDFAINTPDDDFLYLTDAEGGEACFASARNSDQGQVHVYRVATARVPVVITVLRGTYASEIDKDDRKARIVVEDALTKEIVADVRTDINGNYVLALPRSGRYRFLVDAGPQGRTHMGNVEVPRSDGPKAYRQELSLTMHAAQEKLVIRNYFDDPLGGDLIAMALDEIKRRAQLEVGEAPAIVQRPAKEEPRTDLLTEAGFSGDLSPADVQRMADEAALLAERKAVELQDQAELAYGLSLDAVAEAERAARAAEEAVRAAKAAPTDAGQDRATHMLDAANERQRSRDAQLRARAAYQAGRDLEVASLKARQEATEQERRATDLRQATASNDRARTLTALQAVKADADASAKGGGADDAQDLARKQAVDREREAAQAIRRAASSSDEETELVSRIERVRKDASETKNKARKEELEREATTLDAQRQELRKEATEAYARAAVLEREAAIARGQASLVRHLADAGNEVPAKALPKEQVEALGQRISTTETRVAGIEVDQRYEAMLATGPQERERSAFSWGQRADAVAAKPATSRQGGERSASEADAERSAASSQSDRSAAGGAGKDIAAPSADVAKAPSDDLALQGQRTDAEMPATVDAARADANADRTSDRREPDGNTTAGTGSASAGAPAPSAEGATTPSDDLALQRQPTAADRSATGDAARDALSADATARNTRVNDTDLVSMDRGVPDLGGTPSENDGIEREAVRADAARPADGGTPIGSRASDGVGSREGSLVAQDGGVSRTGQGSDAAKPTADAGTTAPTTLAATPEEVREQDMPVFPDPALEVEARIARIEDQRFMKENALAELRQTSAAERDREKRRELEQRAEAMVREIDAMADDIAAAQQELETLAQDGDTERDAYTAGPQGPQRPPARFDAITTDAALLEMVYQGHARDLAATERIADPMDRAEALRGLELMVADSLKAEMERQMTLLEGDSDTRDVAMERIARLQRLQQHHQRIADQVVAGDVIADGSEPGSEEERYLGARPGTVTDRTVPRPQVAAERYVRMERDSEDVYASKLEFRSTKVAEAAAEMDKDLARIETLQADLDSMQQWLRSGEGTGPLDKARKEADRTLDDLLIARTDMGQRTAFIAREEWRTAQDSGKVLGRRVGAMALAPSEPMKLMSDRMKADAEAGFNEANRLRKRADRSEDILVRDSLYRRAYARELAALRDMDRAITVQNYIIGGDFKRGELLAYEEVEALMFGVPGPALAVRTQATEGTPAAPGTGTDENAADARRAQEDGTGGTLARDADRQSDGTTASDGERVGGTGPAEAVAALEHEALLLERRAEELLQEAGRKEVAAPSARPRERAELLAQAASARRLADELAVEAGLKRAQLAAMRQDRSDADDAAVLRDRLHRYYYLSDEEERMVVDDSDMSRYFSARALALEQADKAADLEADANTTKGLANMLKQQAEVIAAEGAQGAASAQQLGDRAAALDGRADSLFAEAARARAAADMNNAQAASMLQGMAPARADGLQALEMRTRRTEPLLSAAAATRRQDDDADGAARAAIDAIAAQETDARTVATPTDDAPSSGASVDGGQDRTVRDAGDVAVATERDAGRDAEGSAAGQDTGAPAGAEEPVPAGTGGATATGTRSSDATSPVQIRTSATDGGTEADRTAGRDERAAGTVTAPAVPERTAPIRTDAPPATPASATTVVRSEGGEIVLPLLPVELVRDEFSLLPLETRRTQPIALNAPMPKGVVYKVQVGAFRNEVPADVFEDLGPMTGEVLPNGLKRYTAGMFTGFDGADAAKEQVRSRGYTDAFVTAYVDGRRVSITDAREEEVRRGATASTPVTPRAAADPVTPIVPAPAAVPTPAPTMITPAVPAASFAEDAEKLLQAYPATAEAILETFKPAPDAASYYTAAPGAAPARQVETVKGLFFTVQVGVYSKPVALDKIFNITPLNSERIDGGKIRYTTGQFADMDRVRTRRDEAVRLGVTDAFITAYINGKRIPVREATALLERFGPSILADQLR